MRRAICPHDPFPVAGRRHHRPHRRGARAVAAGLGAPQGARLRHLRLRPAPPQGPRTSARRSSRRAARPATSSSAQSWRPRARCRTWSTPWSLVSAAATCEYCLEGRKTLCRAGKLIGAPMLEGGLARVHRRAGEAALRRGRLVVRPGGLPGRALLDLRARHQHGGPAPRHPRAHSRRRLAGPDQRPAGPRHRRPRRDQRALPPPGRRREGPRPGDGGRGRRRRLRQRFEPTWSSRRWAGRRTRWTRRRRQRDPAPAL